MMECNVTDHMPVDTQEIQRVMISLVSSSLAPLFSLSLHFLYVYFHFFAFLIYLFTSFPSRPFLIPLPMVKISAMLCTK